MLPADPNDSAVTPEPNPAGQLTPQEPPKPRFDFYTLLPSQTIDVDVDPGEIAKTRTSQSTVFYLLQAGSFKQREDADRRRAELLLLGRPTETMAAGSGSMSAHLNRARGWPRPAA
jgi:cell division protein FtsN